MLRGHLKIFVIKILKDSPMSGYALMSKIEEITGIRPSPGSIYPLLDSLSEKKLVVAKEEGKAKIYSLTKLGRTRLKKIHEQKKEMIDKMKVLISALEGMWDNSEFLFFKSMLDELEKGRFPFTHLLPEMDMLQKNLIPFMDRTHKNTKKLKKILIDTNAKIKEIQ